VGEWPDRHPHLEEAGAVKAGKLLAPQMGKADQIASVEACNGDGMLGMAVGPRLECPLTDADRQVKWIVRQRYDSGDRRTWWERDTGKHPRDSAERSFLDRQKT